jgi:uncharacterized protein YllA (UPF0747 family)
VLSGEFLVKTHCLPFSQIPHTTRLFLDFLAYSSKVQAFYPRSPFFSEWMKDEAAKISYDSPRRERVSSILERQNKSWDASPKTLANLDRLRKGAAAVVTGQQVGLFGGPMFAIYKALTAVKLAEEATAAGVDAVPVFWLATYDHDLAEVNHVPIPGPEGALQVLTTTSHDVPGAPVGAVRLGDEIVPLVEEAAKLLGDSEAAQFLRESYRPGETLGSAFARFYARVFADWGVILLDASDGELDRVADLSCFGGTCRKTGHLAVGARRNTRGCRLSPTSESHSVVRVAFYLAAGRSHADSASCQWRHRRICNRKRRRGREAFEIRIARSYHGES